MMDDPSRRVPRRVGPTLSTTARFTAAVVAVFALASAPLARGAEGAPAQSIYVAGHHPRDNTLLKREWGIEIVFVRESVGGYMLEFRFKVIDADKAAPLFDRQIKPVLVHQRTGARLIVPTPPTTGVLRNTNPPHKGEITWMFFANPGTMVKPGDVVNVEIGQLRVDGIVVEEGK